MNRTQALEVARKIQAEHKAAEIANFFAGRCSDADYAVTDARFGYRHGWYLVEGFSFSRDEVTGESYDMDQGGWAWV